MLSFLSVEGKEKMDLDSRKGTYINKTIEGETYKAYIPPKLPPIPPLNMDDLYPVLDTASRSLAELNTMARAIPNTSLFIYMYVRKEALLSSQIEGTQSSFSDLILFENHQKTAVSIDDVKEVSNYVKAIKYGLERVKEGFPLCLRLLREIHAILLKGTRGRHKQPGEFRKSQNWIGGTRPGNAYFLPPPPNHLNTCLHDFELFMHDTTYPPLIKAGLLHVQFETIHPFLDGNGRLGRLLISLLLSENKLLLEPILYLSLYLKENRSLYYKLLQQVRTEGSWETWLEFFLNGVTETANKALATAIKLTTLFEENSAQINTLGRSKYSILEVFEYMKKCPQVTVSQLVKDLRISAPTARSALNHLVKLKIANEISGLKRDRVYIYTNYLNILEEGTEPL